MEQFTESVSEGTWPPKPEAKKFIFVDRAAEMAVEHKRILEGFGYTVIELNGSPHHVLSFVNAY